MTRFLLIVLAALVLAMIFVETARADTLVYQATGGLVVTITDAPCAQPAIATVLTTHDYKNPKAGTARQGSKAVTLCWAKEDEESIFILDEDGYMGTIDNVDFHRVPRT